MATPADVLNAALSQVGYTENPPGSNHQKFSTELNYPEGQNAAWCSTFVAWCFDKAGYDLRQVVPNWRETLMSTWKTRAALVELGWREVSSPRQGDIIYFSFDGSWINHVGLVLGVNGYYISTVEGNTSSSNSGSQSNGGGVFRRTRILDSPSVECFIRPPSILEMPSMNLNDIAFTLPNGTAVTVAKALQYASMPGDLTLATVLSRLALDNAVLKSEVANLRAVIDRMDANLEKVLEVVTFVPAPTSI